jgi:hypothetical protein
MASLRLLRRGATWQKLAILALPAYGGDGRRELSSSALSRSVEREGQAGKNAVRAPADGDHLGGAY